MNQEAIELLEKANEGTTLLPDRAYYRINPDKYNQALGILKQQPAAGEFTENLRKFVKLYKNEIPRRAEITFLEEACDRLDRAASTNKDLLEACILGLSSMRGLLEIGVEIGANNRNINIHRNNISKVESAIAKAKKEGKTK